MKAAVGYIIIEEHVDEGKWAQVRPWAGIIRCDPHNNTNEGKLCVFDPEAEPRVEIEPGLIIMPYTALMGVGSVVVE